MLRTFVANSIVLAIGLCASARETSLFRAAQGPDGKKAPSESRGKIIEELKSDYGDVVDKLDKKTVDAQMRARQQRIIENLKKLLEDDDNPPPPPSSDAAPMPPPQGADNQQPKPPEPQPKTKPAPQPENAQAEPKPQKQPATGDQGQSESPPRSLREMQKANPNDFEMMTLPKRVRDAMETSGRDRFPPRYEELLRAYYRNLAQSGRRDGNE